MDAKIRAALASIARRPKAVVPIAVVLLVGLATALGIAYGLDVATFVVVVYTAIFSAVAVLGWRPFAALPELDVGLHIGAETIRSVHLPVRPVADIDFDACVKEQVQIAQSTVPPPAPPGRFTGFDPTIERYGTAQERFNKELASYEAEMRGWLETYDTMRWPNYSLVRALISIENKGKSVADGVTLRLILPKGLTTVKDPDDFCIAPPPERPVFEQRSLVPYVSYKAPNVVPQKTGLSAAPSVIEGPEVLVDRNRVTVQFRVETVTHGVAVRSRNPLLVMPGSPGTYVIAWEAYVGNLRHPAQGSISIQVDERPAEPFQLTTVAAVLATREVPVLDN